MHPRLPAVDCQNPPHTAVVTPGICHRPRNTPRNRSRQRHRNHVHSHRDAVPVPSAPPLGLAALHPADLLAAVRFPRTGHWTSMITSCPRGLQPQHLLQAFRLLRAQLPSCHHTDPSGTVDLAFRPSPPLTSSKTAHVHKPPEHIQARAHGPPGPKPGKYSSLQPPSPSNMLRLGVHLLCISRGAGVLDARVVSLPYRRDWSGHRMS